MAQTTGDKQNPDFFMRGDIVVTDCDLVPLLEQYITEGERAEDQRNSLYEDLCTLQTPHPSIVEYTREHPRRSSRPQGAKRPHPSATAAITKKPRYDFDALDAPPSASTSRHPDPPLSLVKDARTLKWMTPEGQLRDTRHQWVVQPAATILHSALPERPTPQLPLPLPTRPLPLRPVGLRPAAFHEGMQAAPAADLNSVCATRQPAAPGAKPFRQKTRRGGQTRKHRDGSINPKRDQMLLERAVSQGDVASSSTFRIIHDASVSPAGFQGMQAPKLARKTIRELYSQEPNARGLHKHLNNFVPLPYRTDPETGKGRTTFIIDKDGCIFFHRSTVASFLVGGEAELEEALAILVADDLEDDEKKAEFAEEVRGPHYPIVLGYHRQSMVTPELTKFHRERMSQVERFLQMEIIQRILKWVKSVIRVVFPHLAARFDQDAAWHKAKYNIEPQFPYFWNLCWNAMFKGQDRIQTLPHTDFKNQIGVCAILTYLTRAGTRFDHKRRSWLVLWELGLTVEMVPWTLATYPSSLLLHFNVDIHELKFVHTAMDVDKPTPDNSVPIQDGDDIGRGSMVFFNQSTMRHGPVTGKDSRKKAEGGRARNFGTDINAAFHRHGHVQEIPLSWR